MSILMLIKQDGCRVRVTVESTGTCDDDDVDFLKMILEEDELDFWGRRIGEAQNRCFLPVATAQTAQTTQCNVHAGLPFDSESSIEKTSLIASYLDQLSIWN